MAEIKTIRHFGWKRQLPDPRDEAYRLELPPVPSLPRYVNLIPALAPPVWDQGNEGSCTGHGSGAVYFASRKKANQSQFAPSRAMIYYNARLLEGTAKQDSGAYIRDACKGMKTWGVTNERLCPYVAGKYAVKPSAEAYTDAEKHQVLQYNPVTQSYEQLRLCLANGFPFVFGFSVFSSFMTAKVARTGMMPVPDTSNESMVGGHCVACFGYNSKGYFLCRNSWGYHWGDPDWPGCFWMPASVIIHPDLAADFWVVKTIEP